MKIQNSNVLVTGGNGMIGRSLVDLLIRQNNKVTIVDLYTPNDLINGVDYIEGDLRYFDFTQQICKNKDFVFNLAGVKGSPKMAMENPASFMIPMLQFNTNMMESARLAGVKRYLYTSSVGVYSPAEIFYEDDVWKTFPSPNDRHAGWAKRIGELQSDAYKIQYKWDNVSIVRPANVYGPYDNFNPNTAMVIPSLITKIMENDTIDVWGDGSNVRDFVYSEDVAQAMIFVMENNISEPLNVGSGIGYTIKELVDIIIELSKRCVRVNWLVDNPSGDLMRVFDTSKISSYGFELKYNLKDGIKKTLEYYINNKSTIFNRTEYFI